MRANLAEVMTEAAYARMFTLAERLADGLRAVIARHGLPWCVTQIGAGTEFQSPTPPRNGSQATPSSTRPGADRAPVPAQPRAADHAPSTT
jgi:glutamate-1-semialdehyde aminotransferase